MPPFVSLSVCDRRCLRIVISTAPASELNGNGLPSIILASQGSVLPTTFSRTTRSLAYDSSRIAIAAWMLGVVIIVVWLAWFFFAQVTVYEVSNLARLEVNRSAHPLAASVAGKIETVSFGLGQRVESGDVLVTLDARSEKLRLLEEEARLQALPPQIALLEKQISELEQVRNKENQAALAAIDSARSRQKAAGAAEAFASDYEHRLSELSKTGKSALIETLRAKAESQKLSSTRDALVSEVQRIEMESQTHRHRLQADLDNLRREVAKLNGERDTILSIIERLKQDIDNHLIRAPASGQIGDSASLPIGTYVEVGEKLASVVPRSELKIVADFHPSAVVGRIRPGQAAQMRLDGFPWAQFGSLAAHVSQVGSEVRDNLVRVEFVPEPEAHSKIVLQHGLPGSIEVSIERLSPALLVLRKSGQWLSAPSPSTLRQ